MASINNSWVVRSKFADEETETHAPDEEWETDRTSAARAYHKRLTAGLWTAIASLTVALGVAAAYGYLVLSKDNAQLAWLPGLAQSVSSVRTRANGLESKLQTWRDGQNNLATQVQKLDADWKSKLSDTRAYAANLVKDAYQNQHDTLDQSTAMLGSEIAQVTSYQRAEQSRVLQLEKELARTRQELAVVRENYAREVTALRGQQAATRSQIASINDLLSTDEVDFGIEKNQREELVPGVSFRLTNTQVRHQSYQGWIWLAASRRMIRVRGQGTQRPVVFYPQPGGEAYELVVTRVNQKDATGYLLVPRNSAPQQAALDEGTKSDTSTGSRNF
jgi:hypothetical protein